MTLSMKLYACLFSFSVLLKDGRKHKGYPDKINMFPTTQLFINCYYLFPCHIQNTKVTEVLT